MAWLAVGGRVAWLMAALFMFSLDVAHAQSNRQAKPSNPNLKPRVGNSPVRSIKSPGNTRERKRLGFKADTVGGNRPAPYWFSARIGIGYKPEVFAPTNGKRTPRRIGFFSRAELARPSALLTAPASVLPIFGSRRTIGYKPTIIAKDSSAGDVPGLFGMRRLIGFKGGYVANKPKLLLPAAPALTLPPGVKKPAPARVIIKGFQPIAK